MGVVLISSQVSSYTGLFDLMPLLGKSVEILSPVFVASSNSIVFVIRRLRLSTYLKQWLLFCLIFLKFLFILLFDRFKDTRVNDIWLVDVSLTLNTPTKPSLGPFSCALLYIPHAAVRIIPFAEVAAVGMGCRKERGWWQGVCRLSSVCVISEWEVMHAGQSQGARRGFISEFVSGSI